MSSTAAGCAAIWRCPATTRPWLCATRRVSPGSSRCRWRSGTSSGPERAPGCGSAGGPGPDAADAIDSVAHDVAGPSLARKLRVWRHVHLGQTVEQIPGLIARLHASGGAEHRVGVQQRAMVPRRIEGEHDARVALDVLELAVVAHVSADDLGPVEADPDHGDLRAAIGIDRGEV